MQVFEDDLDAEIDWDASIPGELVVVNVPFRVTPSAKTFNKRRKEFMIEAEYEGRA